MRELLRYRPVQREPLISNHRCPACEATRKRRYLTSESLTHILMPECVHPAVTVRDGNIGRRSQLSFERMPYSRKSGHISVKDCSRSDSEASDVMTEANHQHLHTLETRRTAKEPTRAAGTTGQT